MLQSNLSFSKLQVVMKPLENFQFSQFMGSMIRGTFGHALKIAFCVMHHRNCSACMLSDSCGYFQIFESEDPTLSKLGFRYKPHPYIITLPSLEEFENTGNLSFELTILGDFKKYTPYLVYAFELMGERGIGKGRVNFSIVSVKESSNKEELYINGKLRLDKMKQFCIQTFVGYINSWKENSNYILNLLSPTKIEEKGKPLVNITGEVLKYSILRRYKLLHNFYGTFHPEDLNIEDISLEPISQKFIDWERYSNRQKSKQKQGGVLGSYNLHPISEKQYLLLKIMEVLHIGKQTSFGMGKIEVSVRGYHIEN